MDWEHLQVMLSSHQLWVEVQLLDRLIYKNRAQHRGSGHFKRLLEVRRLLRLLKELAVPEIIRDAAPGPQVIGRGRDRTAVTKQDAALLLSRLLAGCRVVEKMLVAIQNAVSLLFAQLAGTFFMPFCLATSASLSRVNVAVACWVIEGTKAYNFLVELLPELPVGYSWQPPSRAEGWTLEQAGALPQMLKCQWEHDVVRLQLLNFDGPAAVSGLLSPCFDEAARFNPADGHAGNPLGRECGADGSDADSDDARILPVYVDRGPAPVAAARPGPWRPSSALGGRLPGELAAAQPPTSAFSPRNAALVEEEHQPIPKADDRCSADSAEHPWEELPAVQGHRQEGVSEQETRSLPPPTEPEPLQLVGQGLRSLKRRSRSTTGFVRVAGVTKAAEQPTPKRLALVRTEPQPVKEGRDGDSHATPVARCRAEPGGDARAEEKTRPASVDDIFSALLG